MTKFVDTITVRTSEQAEQLGYESFNSGRHVLMDLTHLDPSTHDWMTTFSVKLPNGQSVTMCVMQCGFKQACVDVRYHGDTIKGTKAMGMKDGRSEFIEDMNLYTVISDTI